MLQASATLPREQTLRVGLSDSLRISCLELTVKTFQNGLDAKGILKHRLWTGDGSLVMMVP